MARKRRKTIRNRYDTWMAGHERSTLFIIGASVALSLFGLFLFVCFSGFGGSVEFIYNQF